MKSWDCLEFLYQELDCGPLLALNLLHFYNNSNRNTNYAMDFNL